MGRCIDDELLKADIRTFAEYESNRNNKDWVRRVEVVIDNQPTADVVEVVRCGGCKYYAPVNSGDHGYCGLHLETVSSLGLWLMERGTPLGREVCPQDYCSSGEPYE